MEPETSTFQNLEPINQTSQRNKAFVKWLVDNSLSKNTLIMYENYLKHFGNRAFTNDSIRKFISEHNNSVGRAFINNLKEFYLESSYVTEEEKMRIGMVHVPRRRGDKAKHKEKKVITQEEFNSLYSRVANQQTKVMLSLSYYCALRSFELVGLNGLSFNWPEWEADETKNGKLTLVGKRNKLRTIFVPNFVMVEVRNYFMDREVEKGLTVEKPLFEKSLRSWREIVNRISDKVLGYKISTHVFRRSFATNMLEGGFDLIEIRDHLGHSSIATTQIYTQLSTKKLGEKYKEFTKKS